MLLPDVNVLIYAHDVDALEHERYASWLQSLVRGGEPFALSEPVLAGFLRVVTNQRIYKRPSTRENAFAFIEELQALPAATLVRPGPRHWGIFRKLCESTNVRGKLIADAAHAALAIETDCEWVTADTDFARFSPPLRWRHL